MSASPQDLDARSATRQGSRRRGGSQAETYAASPLTDDPCNLCPRMCGARRASGQRGVCGADNRMFIARAALHYWEEPPLSGHAGSGAVFFSRCPLRCVYCQNSTIANADAGREVSEERLAQICLELADAGALNVNFVTPTHHSLAIRRAVASARAAGLCLPIVWNTSGYERCEAIEALADTVDIYLADFKYADARLAERYSRAPDYPDVALSAIEKMLALTGEPTFDEHDGQMRMTRGVIVRHLVLPDAPQNSLRALDALWERFGNAVLYSIMNQYTPLIEDERFPELRETVPTEEYERILDHADALGMDDYFWQDGPAAAESFIPAWNGEGV